MDYEMEVEVFRAGDYGPRGVYGEQDLDRIAADYSKETHEAPVTLDHRQDGPAQGWVRGLKRVGRVLLARLGGLDKEFLEKLKAGTFKKRSVEFYRAAQATGRPYLRAVTFLGAGAPVVKGLSDPLFSDSDDCARIEFTENDAPEIREPVRENEMVIACGESADAGGEGEAKNCVFFDELCKQGRFLPAWEDRGIGRFMAGLDDIVAHRFGPEDSGDTGAMTQRAWFRRFLESLAPAIPMGEALAAPPNAPAGYAGAAPAPLNWRGARFDEESLALHKRVCRYRAAHPEANYAEALRAVSQER